MKAHQLPSLFGGVLSQIKRNIIERTSEYIIHLTKWMNVKIRKTDLLHNSLK